MLVCIECVKYMVLNDMLSVEDALSKAAVAITVMNGNTLCHSHADQAVKDEFDEGYPDPPPTPK